MSDRLEIQYVPTDQLQMYENNANLHSARQIDQIAESIEEFDFSSPILAWHDEDGNAVIVAGHGRLMAANKLGITELPVVFLDHLTDEQRRAFTLVENQLTRLSEFDMGMLEVEINSIVNIDMGQFDFQLETDTDDEEYHSEDFSDKFTDTLGVFITCKDEQDQQRTYEEILEGGYECRLLTL